MTDDKAEGVGNVEPSDQLVALWAGAATWTPEEGVALAFSADPEKAVERSATGYGGSTLRLPDPARHFVKLAHRAVRAGKLAEDSNPACFLFWSEAVGLWFHRKWWQRISPFEPLGPDGNHITETRKHRKSSDFIATKTRLIAKWKNAPTWTLVEGTALSLNYPPEKVELNRGIPALIFDEFRRRKEFAQRARARRQLKANPTPLEFVRWAAASGFPFDEPWFTSLKATEASYTVGDGGIKNSEIESLRADRNGLQNQKNEIRAEADAEKELNPRVRETLLKMIIGMAHAAYCYDPKKSRSPIPREIADDLVKLGIPVSDDTIRKYLQQASELVDRDILDGIVGK